MLKRLVLATCLFATTSTALAEAPQDNSKRLLNETIEDISFGVYNQGYIIRDPAALKQYLQGEWISYDTKKFKTGNTITFEPVTNKSLSKFDKTTRAGLEKKYNQPTSTYNEAVKRCNKLLESDGLTPYEYLTKKGTSRLKQMRDEAYKLSGDARTQRVNEVNQWTKKYKKDCLEHLNQYRLLYTRYSEKNGHINDAEVLYMLPWNWVGLRREYINSILKNLNIQANSITGALDGDLYQVGRIDAIDRDVMIIYQTSFFKQPKLYIRKSNKTLLKRLM